MSKQVTRILFTVVLMSWIVSAAFGQTNLSAKANSLQPSAASGNESDRVRDGLQGPVRRVRTEVVKLSTASGKTVEEGKRVVLETAEYDLKGTKTQNQYFPDAGSTLTGHEVYKYDDKGNISEMTLVNGDGSLVSKEVYKYESDSLGNWVKMTTSVAVVENGHVAFEPTEVTYRTIFYYLDATMAKMVEPADNSAPATKTGGAGSQVKPTVETSKEVKAAGNTAASANHAEGEKVAATLSLPTSSLDKLKLSAAQPGPVDIRGAALDTNKKVVVDNAPPPAPRPLLKPVSGGVLNGMALVLPPPSYPDTARRMRQAGIVQVEVVVDENGKVISARALSGPSTLREVAVEAAYRARFSPTKLSGQPVKVTGQINYNFTLP